MTRNASEAYLETLVRTATPQRLQLLLIENALRFARSALAQWQQGKVPSGSTYEAVVRCRDIVAHIYGSIRQDDPVAKQVAAIYAFLFDRLVEVPRTGDAQGLHDIIRVLEEERTTWQQVCTQMPEAPAGGGRDADAEITAADAQTALGDRAISTDTDDHISLEA